MPAGRAAFALLLGHSTLVQAVTFGLRPAATYRAIELDVPGTLLGVAHLGSVVGQQALVANRTPAHRYDAAFGYDTFAVSLGRRRRVTRPRPRPGLPRSRGV